eukprot:8005613-Heterocapsa_arctica.AAC.1
MESKVEEPHRARAERVPWGEAYRDRVLAVSKARWHRHWSQQDVVQLAPTNTAYDRRMGAVLGEGWTRWRNEGSAHRLRAGDGN